MLRVSKLYGTKYRLSFVAQLFFETWRRIASAASAISCFLVKGFSLSYQLIHSFCLLSEHFIWNNTKLPTVFCHYCAPIFASYVQNKDNYQLPGWNSSFKPLMIILCPIIHTKTKAILLKVKIKWLKKLLGIFLLMVWDDFCIIWFYNCSFP